MPLQELLTDFSVQFIRPHVIPILYAVFFFALWNTNKYFLKDLNISQIKYGI